MKKLSLKSTKILKLFHIVLSAMWLGGSSAVVLLSILRARYGVNSAGGIYVAMKSIDDIIIVPGAMGGFITGLCYSLFTNWGFLKHKWIMTKWVIIISQIILGAGFLSTCVNGNFNMIQKLGSSVILNPLFLQNESFIITAGIIQTIFIIVLMMLSIFKPFSKKAKVVAKLPIVNNI